LQYFAKRPLIPFLLSNYGVKLWLHTTMINGKADTKPLGVVRVSWIKKPVTIGLVAAVVCLTIILILKDPNTRNLLLDVKSLFESYGLLGVFIATILAGTVIPLGSPALVLIAASFGLPQVLLIVVATTGFTIGMAINYGLAYKLGRPYVAKKLGEDKLKEILNLWTKRGWAIYVIFGLIPIMPVEVLSLLCGLLKARFDVFLILTFVTRLILFTVLVYFGEQMGIWLGII